MKTIAPVGLILFFGLLSFGVYKYYLQPLLTAESMESSIRDCVFAAQVGTGGAGHVQFSPDGKQLAIMSNSRQSILDAKSGDFICDFAKANEKTTGFRFSPDSSMIAYGDASTIQIKNVSGEKISEIDISKDGTLGTLGDIAFDPNQGAIIATCKGGICVYEPSGNRVKHIPAEHSIRHVSVREGTIIAADFKGRVIKWADAIEDQRSEIQAHKKYIAKAKLSPNGEHFLTLGRDHQDANGDFDLKVWSADDLTLIQSIPIGKHVTAFSVDANSENLLVSKSTGEAFVFSLETFDVKKGWQMPRGISSSDIAPDSLTVCFGLSKSVTSIDTDTHHDFVTGRFRTRRNGKPIPYQTIKGQSVSPGAVVVLASRLDEIDSPIEDQQAD